MRGLLLTLILAGGALAESPAVAADTGLRVCNDSGRAIDVALGQQADKGWQSEGWTPIGAGDCAPLIEDRLTKPYYYLYATDETGGAWQGDTFLCARGGEFSIFGTGDCLARGYVRTPFFEIATGGRSTWTVYLTARGAAAIEASADITAWEQASTEAAAPYRLREVVTPSASPVTLMHLLAESETSKEDADAVLAAIGPLGSAEASELRTWLRSDDAGEVIERMSFINGGQHVVTVVRHIGRTKGFVLGIDPGR